MDGERDRQIDMGDKHTGKLSLGPEYDHQVRKESFLSLLQQKGEPEIEIAFLLQVTKVLRYSYEAMLKQR